MPRRTIRLTAATDERIEFAAKLGGYSSPNALLKRFRPIGLGDATAVLLMQLSGAQFPPLFFQRVLYLARSTIYELLYECPDGIRGRCSTSIAQA